MNLFFLLLILTSELMFFLCEDLTPLVSGFKSHCAVISGDRDLFRSRCMADYKYEKDTSEV